MPLPSSLKSLLIDLDGTIADSTPFLYKAYESVMKKRSLHATKEEYLSLCGPTIVEASSILHKKYALKEDPETIYKEWKSVLLPYYSNEIPSADGVEELFALAKGRWKLALVTSAEEVFAKAFLKRHSFPFDVLVCKEDFKKSKPDPEPYLLALKKLHTKPSEAIAIEDSDNGALSATRSGLYTFFIGKSIHANTHEVENFSSVTDILRKKYA